MDIGTSWAVKMNRGRKTEMKRKKKLGEISVGSSGFLMYCRGEGRDLGR